MASENTAAEQIPEWLQTANPQGWQGVKGCLFTLFQFMYVIGSNFLTHKGPLRASALTYTTTLSLVPFLAITFSVLKGLGAQNSLEPLLRRVAGDSQETVSRLIGYVNNTDLKSMGVIGLLALLLTVISLLESIEEAFNAIWGVRETRPLQRRFSDYLSVAVVGPLLILLAMSMTTSLQSQWMVKWLIANTYLGDAILLLFRLVPYLSIWVAMVLLYTFLPNTRIRFASALTGGILAGTIWQIAQWGYFHFQVGVANYNAIYGTLAALPIFLVWIYTSWIIVLFGLEVVYAHQHRRHGPAVILPDSKGYNAGEEVALALLVLVCRCFQKGVTPPGSAFLADELHTSVHRIDDELDTLQQLGFIVPTSGREPGWLPAKEPSETTVCEVLAALRGTSVSAGSAATALNVAGDVLQKGWGGTKAALGDMTLYDLMERKTKSEPTAPVSPQ